MDDLVEALTILRKYLENTNDPTPTHCEHDVLFIMSVENDVSDEDRVRLNELGFFWSDGEDVWASYRFGSA